MLFKTVFKKGKKILVKIALDDGNEVWATTTQAVYNWASKNFTEGDEVDVDYTLKNGQYFVKRISEPNKDGSKKTSSPKETTSDSEYTCEECGASLKDGKYKKCYTCNQKKPSSKNKSSRTDEVGKSIERQAMMKASCDAIKVLTGQVSDIETLGEMIIGLYRKLISEISQ